MPYMLILLFIIIKAVPLRDNSFSLNSLIFLFNIFIFVFNSEISSFNLSVSVIDVADFKYVSSKDLFSIKNCNVLSISVSAFFTGKLIKLQLVLSILWFLHLKKYSLLPLALILELAT